jgi:hypothetical protein
MDLAALRRKVQQNQEDCALMQMRLDNLTELGKTNDPEVRSVVRAHALACEWASKGAAEIERRAKTPQRRQARKPVPAAPAVTPSLAPPKPKTPWGWIIGIGAVGAGGLALLVRRLRG